MSDQPAVRTEEATEVVLNGAPARLPAGATVADAAAVVLSEVPTAAADGGTGGTDGDARGVAVAVDDEVVPRSAWATTPVAAGAHVEVVHLVAGG